MEVEVQNGEEMQKIAGEWVQTLRPKENGATVLALSGELGAGKTTFTQGIARGLGVTEQVTSPTFVIQKTYPLDGQYFARLVHIDAYRLADEKELNAIDFQRYVEDSKNLIVIEWPERVPGVFNKDNCVPITIGYKKGEERHISIGNLES